MTDHIAPSYTVSVPTEEIGRRFARGVLREIFRWFLWIVGAYVFLCLAFPSWDATDDRAAGEHSEMHLRTDHGTGCQYLESAKGSLSPRLGRDGKQVCQ